MKNLLIFICLIFLGCNAPIRKELPKTEMYENLIGKWKVTKSNVLPFEHISFCEKLDLNSIFEFDKYGIIRVFSDKNIKQNCNKEQSFKIDDNELIIWEYDVGFEYEILKLTPDSLIIKTDRVPMYIYEMYPIEKSKKQVERIEKSGITIEMIKIKNSG